MVSTHRRGTIIFPPLISLNLLTAIASPPFCLSLWKSEGKKKSRRFPFLSCLKSFIRHPKVFNTVDPGLKIAGVTNKAIEPFRGRLKTA